MSEGSIPCMHVVLSSGMFDRVSDGLLLYLHLIDQTYHELLLKHGRLVEVRERQKLL